MSVLEDRYRSVLRILPASYREVWEAEMVATFVETARLDDPEENAIREDYGRPHWAEVASVVALAVRLRLGGVDASPRSFAWGEAVRRVALVALLVQSALATVHAVETLWLTGAISWPPLPEEGVAFAAVPSGGAWYTYLDPAGFLWVAAFLLLVFDRRRPAQVVAVWALVPSLVGLARATGAVVRHGGPLPLLGWAMFLMSALTVLALAAFHRGAPSVPRRPWLIAFGVGVLGNVVVFIGLVWSVTAPLWVDGMGLACVVLAGAVVVHLARPALGHGGRSPIWSLALALLAAMALIDRLLWIAGFALGGPFPGRATVLAVYTAEAAMVLAVLIALIVVVAPVLRRLPETNGSGSRLSSGHRGAVGDR